MDELNQKQAIFDKRRAGILLHPTSLPGHYAGGDLGAEAFRFIDFLQSCGCSIWQMLPLGPTHSDGSPYQCLSVHAGNPLLISPDWLVDQGWLDFSETTTSRDSQAFRQECLAIAGQYFFHYADKDSQKQYQQFKQEQQSWLDDYALFVAIKRVHQGKGWSEWPDALRLREPAALSEIKNKYRHFISQVEFEQFVFFNQWHELREYARQKGVMLFGDMPIFVSHDSADVWAQRKNFQIDDLGKCLVVAGVPPDAFSETGQRWGNPLYDWEHMLENNFDWWKDRFRTQLELFDLIRIDHFRGFSACWQIDASEETAINGEWVEVPGEALLTSLTREFKNLVLVAEDLGLITDDVHALRDHFNLPGMKVLQFAFDSDPQNIYLPYNYQPNTVVYTGTHDNDTSLGWYLGLEAQARHCLHEYLGKPDTEILDMPWALNRLALASVSKLAILPMQDILSLDSQHRMNIPGTTENNWLWRFDWAQIWPSLSYDLRKLIEVYGRC